MSQASSDGPLRTRGLVLAAIGVVFGDIGTSPLYAVKECFDLAHNTHAVSATRDHVLGIMSLIFWSLSLIVTV
jgi:KUP system potassium uptake protein